MKFGDFALYHAPARKGLTYGFEFTQQSWAMSAWVFIAPTGAFRCLRYKLWIVGRDDHLGCLGPDLRLFGHDYDLFKNVRAYGLLIVISITVVVIRHLGVQPMLHLVWHTRFSSANNWWIPPDRIHVLLRVPLPMGIAKYVPKGACCALWVNSFLTTSVDLWGFCSSTPRIIQNYGFLPIAVKSACQNHTL